jgi:hypothetical protein
MSQIEELRIGQLHEFDEVSRHPALRELQLLQLSAELEDDPQARDRLYDEYLPVAARPILGNTFLMDARRAVGVGRDEEEGDVRQVVFENGLLFFATATLVGHVVNLNVPTDSLGIGFKLPRPASEDADDDFELAQRLAEETITKQGRIELEFAWVPAGAMRRCAVEIDHSEKTDRLKDDYLMSSAKLQLYELGLIKQVSR